MARRGEGLLGIPVRIPMGEVGRRRWRNFKANRRGWWSLWIFLFLFVVTLFAELIANDKPLLLRYRGEFYVPVLRAHPETAFGGFFETEAEYRDPEVRALIEAKGWMLWPPIPYSYDTVSYELPSPAPSPPTARNWLGTDDQARRSIEHLKALLPKRHRAAKRLEKTPW